MPETKTKENWESDGHFYKKYENMVGRCRCKNNQAYERYGGRGIRILWKNFEEFKRDMYPSYLKHLKEYGEKDTTIERINNEGDYCKENCRWATFREQEANRSDTNRVPTIHFETAFGMSDSTFRRWLKEEGSLKAFEKAAEMCKTKYKNEPLGVTPWKEHGKKYGYWQFFADEIKAGCQAEIREELAGKVEEMFSACLDGGLHDFSVDEELISKKEAIRIIKGGKEV